MEQSLGSKLSALRKEHSMTQEEVASRVGVSPQAVSKWENDQSYPDIMLLPQIAQMYGVTVDELLSREPKQEVQVVPEAQRKDIDQMILRIYVDSKAGDRVRVNLPMALVKVALEMGLELPQVAGNKSLSDIDLNKVFRLVQEGVIGKLVEVESADGDTVSIVVE